MSHSELTEFFKNPKTGQLKEVIAFVVDNGPSEAPANLQVQVLLVQLLKFLNLDKATQRSFAEYLSKRNFVERVHAMENTSFTDMECSGHIKFTSMRIPVCLSTRKIWRQWLKMLSIV